jgi:hypothetical protein
VLIVVKLHDPTADVRLQGPRVVGKIREGIGLVGHTLSGSFVKFL